MEDEKKKKILEMEELIEKDLIKKGFTDRKCPFCKTNLKLKGTLTSHSIECEKEGCFKYSVRGL